MENLDGSVDCSIRLPTKRSRSFPLSHKLSISEFNRGYKYVTKSAKILSSINSEKLIFILVGESLFNRSIVQGRVVIGRGVMERLCFPGMILKIDSLTQDIIRVDRLDGNVL